ncbi:hypothetical protein [Saccharothrix algeriensis]|uniref:Uncharacterized protein n=1 Tax=Saccharothrix algeriensis TaxID=173560 RepID=A0A8T8HU27_9PSEU|nr:hypothetical protein [Saccharothrix algeriensis]MBM7813534.1 hypothetical protein [Saccharothrix algeriensis]QTR02038.1 hypothetical protein J7S33_22775 [Saccharothrix algeriensis]
MKHQEHSAKARRRLTERLACTLVFTAVQLWAAAVIVTQLKTSGVVALAVALVVSGGLLAVHDAWQEVRSERRGPEAGAEAGIGEDLARL